MSRFRKNINSGPTPQSLGVATEDFRIYLDEIFRDFKKQNDIEFYEFPSDLNNAMRKYIHEKCRVIGLKSKSHGKEPNRIITIYKKLKTTNVETFNISLSNETKLALQAFAKQHPTLKYDNSNKRQKIQTSLEPDTFGKLSVGQLVTVCKPLDNPLLEFRKTLPIYPLKDQLLEILTCNRVIIVSAETGSGKTTQIPQYILDDACAKLTSVKVICTQPRRLSTIAIAERVANERGEKLGVTVGYQIKLESKLGPKTSLVYCTNGVLLRTLMNGDECFNNISHVIVDEIHERDKYSDFLLICLRECLKNYRHLKVILMSATMDMHIYKEYFGNVKIIDIPGRQHTIVEWFLDDILPQLNYENRSMKEIRILREKNGISGNKTIIPPIAPVNIDLDSELAAEMNLAINNCYDCGTEDDFAHMMQLLLSESVAPNYQESLYGYTPLIVAAKHGYLHEIEQLLNLGADPFISSHNGLTPSGWAQQCGKEDVVNILSMYQGKNYQTQEASTILADYDRTINEEFIDYDLVTEVIKYIHLNLDKTGAILVFLPGYDDIINCNERIQRSGLNNESLGIFMLHGSMEMKSQHQIFKKLPPGKQKIILSTNVAETSITIDDVLYVVDTGKAKEKSYDALSGTSSLKTNWISMASVRQRAGRAGRVQSGYCFHLFSVNRYESLALSTTPEILRVPLDELCLQTKMLAPKDMAIASFLNMALEPPSRISVNNAINGLMNLGALDKEEQLTPLGQHLVQLSLDPHLGKMLIYSAIFKCLDPVLTIVSCLAHKDPFILPSQSNLKARANEVRRKFSDESLSDHMALLRSFQNWQDSKVSSNAYRFCEENFISPACMDMIMQTRTQLLSQLRAVGFVLANPKENINELNQNSSQWPLVKGCLAAGIYPNLAYYNGKKLHTKMENQVHINIASCLRNSLYDFSKGPSSTQYCWVLYEELNKNGTKCTIRCATAVNPLTIVLLCGSEFDAQDDGNIVLDNWYDLHFENNNVTHMRKAVDVIIDKKVNMPRYRLHPGEDETIKEMARILLIEDKACDLPETYGVGIRPKLLHYRSSNNGEYSDKRNNQKYNNYVKRNNKPPYQDHRSQYQEKPQYQNRTQYQDKTQHQDRPQYQDKTQYQDRPQYQNNHYNNMEPVAGPSGSHRYQNNRAPQYSTPNYYTNSGFHDKSAGFPNEDWSNKTTDMFPVIASYFIIKPLEEKSVFISFKQQTWNFAAQTERKLFKHFLENRTIILIYTVKTSNKFQGVAKLVNTNNGVPNQPCPIEWITSNQVSYNDVKHLIHPKMHLSEDGNELEPSIGQKLCTFICQANQRSNRPIFGRNRHH